MSSLCRTRCAVWLRTVGTWRPPRRWLTGRCCWSGTAMAAPSCPWRRRGPTTWREIFAADVPASTAAVMAVSQRPADLATLRQPSGEPAWKTIPSWTLVAKDDQVIPAATQRFMANRASAHVVGVRASHVAMTSRPDVTLALILQAASHH
ncbi:alpha/beta fold hydrolase [Micromonospora sp. ATCC 39149]